MLIAFSVGSVEVTSTSWFCNRCHIMNTYHASWTRSEHKEVACVECHIEPGVESLVQAKLNGLAQALDDILRRTSTKPSAAVSDLSCTRVGCHRLEELDEPAAVGADAASGKAAEEPPAEIAYKFTHAEHQSLEHQGIGVHCTTCHSHISGQEHFQLNPNACVTCHLIRDEGDAETPRLVAVSSTSARVVGTAGTGPTPSPEAPGEEPDTQKAQGDEKVATSNCRDCHEPPDEPIDYNGLTVVHTEYLAYGAGCESCHRGVTAQPQAVTDDECMGCHDFGRERLTTVQETHEQHSSGRHKVECFRCHGRIVHGPSAETMRLAQIDCQACHAGQHVIQRETYEAAGPGEPAPAGASFVTPMFLAHVDCTGCHNQPRGIEARPGTGATVAKATPEACNACHKPGLGEQMVALWQKNTHELYDSVAAMLPDPAEPLPSARAEVLTAEARHLLMLVRLDGSWGVHNPPYTEKLIRQARQKLLQAEALYAKRQ